MFSLFIPLKQRDSMEKVGEPGSARYGNFINYYSFNPPNRRLGLIPGTLLNDLFDEEGYKYKETPQPIVALDVGCNAGVRFYISIFM